MISQQRLLMTLIVLTAIGMMAAIILALLHLTSPWTAALLAILLAVLEAFLLKGESEYVSIRQALENFADNPEGELPTFESASDVSTGLWMPILRTLRLLQSRIARMRHEIQTAHRVLSSLPDALLLINNRREIVDANSAARDLFGDNLLRRDLSAALRNPAVLDAADAVLRGEQDRVVELDLSVPVELHLSAHIAPLPVTQSGNEPAALITLIDLTSMKRAEQMRVDFVANASHELRTPLAALLGFIETLQGPAADDAEAHKRFLGIMHQQGSRMSRLIDDLLSLSRIELNEHQPPQDHVPLVNVLQQVAQALELKAADRDMRIEIDISAETLTVLGDADELTQVFQNLIDNALKYGRPGSPVAIAVTASERMRQGLSIAIRDYGEGIARRHLPRLTERFYRIDTARSRQMGGTGLGLAIVKHIVNRHRGILEIESELGEGSVFTVHLRAAAIPIGESSSAALPPPRIRRG